MRKTEFIQTLQGRLAETMDPAQVAKHVRYYEAYIAEQMADGMPEEEVLDRLGDPLLIAKTIMDTSDQQMEREVIYESREDSAEDFYKEGWEDSGQMPDMHQTRISAQGGCLLAAIIVVLVITLVLWLVGSVISFLLPVLVPLLIIVMVVAYFKQR